MLETKPVGKIGPLGFDRSLELSLAHHVVPIPVADREDGIRSLSRLQPSWLRSFSSTMAAGAYLWTEGFFFIEGASTAALTGFAAMVGMPSAARLPSVKHEQTAPMIPILRFSDKSALFLQRMSE